MIQEIFFLNIKGNVSNILSKEYTSHITPVKNHFLEQFLEQFLLICAHTTKGPFNAYVFK